jgi:hypothetical protein
VRRKGVDATRARKGGPPERHRGARPVGLQELFTVNGDAVASAGDNKIQARNVGADVVRLTPDGTLIVTTTGQVPFMFTGVLKINLDTGEPILEPHHFADIEKVCAQLTA